MPNYNEIIPEALMRLIGTPSCPRIVDVCIDDDFSADPNLIPTAQRVPHDDLDAIAALGDGREIVVVCQKGLKLSHGVAAYLRARGATAQVLSGGNQGWRDAELPRVPAASQLGPLWVTRHRPKIDRIACPWLIRRFIDPKARFLFVPPATVADVAARFGATPFDVDIPPFTHCDDRCTFDAMLDHFGLDLPALRDMATVIRAADTDRHDHAPQAAGLLALSVGLSRMYRDDTEQLEAGMGLYDALYRWARDGQGEGHDWPGGQGK